MIIRKIKTRKPQALFANAVYHHARMNMSAEGKSIFLCFAMLMNEPYVINYQVTGYLYSCFSVPILNLIFSNAGGTILKLLTFIC